MALSEMAGKDGDGKPAKVVSYSDLRHALDMRRAEFATQRLTGNGAPESALQEFFDWLQRLHGELRPAIRIPSEEDMRCIIAVQDEMLWALEAINRKREEDRRAQLARANVHNEFKVVMDDVFSSYESVEFKGLPPRVAYRPSDQFPTAGQFAHMPRIGKSETLMQKMMAQLHSGVAAPDLKWPEPFRDSPTTINIQTPPGVAKPNRKRRK